MTEITTEDIEWWEQFLYDQNTPRSVVYYPFIEHILKLANVVKEFQER